LDDGAGCSLIRREGNAGPTVATDHVAGRSGGAADGCAARAPEAADCDTRPVAQRAAPARVGTDVVALDGGTGLSSNRRTEVDAAVRVAADDVARRRARATDGVIGGRKGNLILIVDHAYPFRIALSGHTIRGDAKVGAAHRAAIGIGQVD